MPMVLVRPLHHTPAAYIRLLSWAIRCYAVMALARTLRIPEGAGIVLKKVSTSKSAVPCDLLVQDTRIRLPGRPQLGHF